MANNPRDLTPNEQHDLTDLNGPDVPAYTGETTSGGMYTRTGKAAPTEIVPRGEQDSGPLIPQAQAPETTAFETASVEREPAYAAPAASTAVAESTEPTYAETAEPVVVEDDTRRGTTDFGLFLLRLALGAFFIIGSVGTFFRLGGNEGISGLESAFADYPYGDGLAVVVPTLELAAGVFLVLGLLTPVAALVAITVSGFMALHAFTQQSDGFNVFAWSPETWVPVMLLAASLAVQFTGPGRYGIDASRGWAKRPLASSWICAVLGLAAAGLIWWFGTEVNPFS
ncbi:DoxX family protein [Corynebacterium fournieri]|uniref:DoxX family protein n=1 Tax=Corynebacterium fournieri TaxID=1852390 RepID=UPI000C760B3E|nr:DoxX family protein [Corynebacterium fournieri]WJY97414.1 DoxX [Corynebacterium fournieri]